MRLKKGIKLILFCVVVLAFGGIFFLMTQKKPESFILDPSKPEKKVEVTALETNIPKYYLAIKGHDTIKYTIETNDGSEANVTFASNNPEIVTVSEDGVITGVKEGNTTVTLKALDKTVDVPVVVTKLIIPVTPEYNFKNSYLKCGQYTNEQNALLDEVLASRIAAAGYHTRAGVVAAARFWLEFPYRVEYFSENGRLYKPSGQPYVDGEGRYYHKGLYLSESKFAELDPKGIKEGPATWGCKIASWPSNNKKISNGFDCSGFITWIVYNGGYDPGDIGAGITSVDDMTDLGPKIKTSEAVPRNSIKTGDLLSTYEITGEHIAIVAGQDENNYYVAESLWKGSAAGHYGAVITTYKRSELTKYFFWQIDMDDYYGEDGNLTDYWM